MNTRNQIIFRLFRRKINKKSLASFDGRGDARRARQTISGSCRRGRSRFAWDKKRHSTRNIVCIYAIFIHFSRHHHHDNSAALHFHVITLHNRASCEKESGLRPAYIAIKGRWRRRRAFDVVKQPSKGRLIIRARTDCNLDNSFPSSVINILVRVLNWIFIAQYTPSVLTLLFFHTATQPDFLTVNARINYTLASSQRMRKNKATDFLLFITNN